MSTRIDRISEEVMKALAEALRSVKDPRVQNAMVSVVHCDVTNDLRYAKCYISVLGSEQQAKDVMKGLKSAAGWLRREVGHKVQLRYAPELVFELDESITRGHRRIASCDLRILQNIRPLADLAQTAAQSAGAACGIAVRAAVGQDENIVMRLQSGSRFSNVNDHSSSSPPSFPSFFSSCSISEMCAPRVIDSSSSNTSSGA